MSREKTKKPRIDQEPCIKKQPTLGSYLPSNDSGPVSWSFSLVDCDGPWGFNKICRDELY